MVPVTLICPHCGTGFVIPRWRAAKAEKEGRRPYCGTKCASDARRTRTPETIAEYHRAYRAAHREEKRQYNRAYSQGVRREKILADKRARYAKNIEKHRAVARAYAASHKEDAYVRQRQWAKEKPDKALFHATRSNLAQKIGVKPREVPRDLVEAHIEYLKLRRWVLESRNGMETAL